MATYKKILTSTDLDTKADVSNPTFTTRITTPQVRFTDGSGTTFNHLNTAQWQSAYNWGDHSTEGYLTSSSTINATTLKNIGLTETGVNNVASKVMATDGNGYANFGWINTTSGEFTGTPNRIYASSDQYMRYMTLANFRSAIFDVSGGGDSIGTTDGQNFHIKTNGQYRISLTSTGVISLLGVTKVASTMQFDGNQTIETVGGSDSLYINPQANLHLGTTSTDHTYIGASGRNVTINATTTAIGGTTNISGALNVSNSTPFLYVGDASSNNDGTWDTNLMMDSHHNSRLRIEQRHDNKNLELYVHGGVEPTIRATDSATTLRLGVGGNVGLELGSSGNAVFSGKIINQADSNGQYFTAKQNTSGWAVTQYQSDSGTPLLNVGLNSGNNFYWHSYGTSSTLMELGRTTGTLNIKGSTNALQINHPSFTSQYGFRTLQADSGNAGILTTFQSQRINTWTSVVQIGNGANANNPSLRVMNGQAVFEGTTKVSLYTSYYHSDHSTLAGYVGSADALSTYDTSDLFIRANKDLHIGTNNSGTSRMVVKASGDIGINVPSPSHLLHLEGAIGVKRIGVNATSTIDMEGNFTFNSATGYSHLFEQGGTEVARIHSSGDLQLQERLAFRGTNDTTESATINLHSNNYLYIAGGTAGLVLGNSDTSTKVQFMNGSTQFENAGSVSIKIDSSGKVGIGTSSPVAKVDIVGTRTLNLTDNITDDNNKNAVITSSQWDSGGETEGFLMMQSFSSNSTNRVDIGGGNSGYNSAEEIRFFTGGDTNVRTGTQAMHIDNAQNVGIGTSSPSEALEINKSGANLKVVSDNNVYLSLDTTQTNGDEWQIFNANSGATSTLQFKNIDQSKVVMLMDETGNVGIGTTSPLATLHVKHTTDDTDENGNLGLTIGGDSAGEVRHYFGVNNASNYAYYGAVEHATQYVPLILQPNGSTVGINCTDPNSQFMVGGSTSGGGEIAIASTSTNILNTHHIGQLLFKGKDDGGTAYGIGAKIQATATQDWDEGAKEGTKLQFLVTNNNQATNTLAMVIDSDGTVYPTGNLIVSGALYVDSINRRTTGSGITFGTDLAVNGYVQTTQVRRKGSSGQLTIGEGSYGTTVDTNELLIKSNSDNPKIKFVNSSNSPAGYLYGNTTDSNWGLLDSSGNWAYRIYNNGDKHEWRHDGSVTMFLDDAGDLDIDGSLREGSDRNLKKDIVTVANPLDKLDKIRGVDFTWKRSGKKGGGVIAQEVQEVMPDYVANLHNGSGHLGVDYNGIIGVLVESVKELKKEIEFLKANTGENNG